MTTATRPAAVRRRSGAATRHWLGRGSSAAIDQTSMGFGHFAVHVLAGRWMSVEEYGIFAAIYAAVVLANMLHNSLIVEPALVFGSRTADTQRARFLGDVLKLNIFLVGLFAAVAAAVALIALVVGADAWFRISLLVAAAAAFLSPFWLARRLFYIDDNGTAAAATSVSYTVLTLGGVAALQRFDMFSGAAAILTLAIAGLAVGVIALLKIRPAIDTTELWPSAAGREMYRYGRWAAGTSSLTWVVNNGYYFVLPILSGAAAAGAFRAVMNVFLPIQHVLIGLTATLLPALSKHHAERISLDVRPVAVPGGMMLLVASAYSVFVWLAGSFVMSFMYAGKYDGLADALLLAVIVPPCWALTYAAITLLRAGNLPHAVFRAHLLVVVLLASWIIPLTAQAGVSRALGGFAILQLCLVLASVAQVLLDPGRVRRARSSRDQARH